MEPAIDFLPTGNLFLDHAPEHAIRLLKPYLKRVELPKGTVVGEPNRAADHVFFPIDSIISVVLELQDGCTAEVGLIGREGMSGAVIALGQTSANQQSVVQVPGEAYTVAADRFKSAVEAEPELRAFCLRYVQAIIMMTAQFAACNTLHVVNERCARWLLMAHDRVEGNRVRLTQEYLGQMLGVRRNSVTVAASTMQAAGYILYSRGLITILDRGGLEVTACECYQAIQREWSGLMGYSVAKQATASCENLEA